jgi:hypothetical protein
MRKESRIKPQGTAFFRGQMDRINWQMNLSKNSQRIKRKTRIMDSKRRVFRKRVVNSVRGTLKGQIA